MHFFFTYTRHFYLQQNLRLQFPRSIFNQAFQVNEISEIGHSQMAHWQSKGNCICLSKKQTTNLNVKRTIEIWFWLYYTLIFVIFDRQTNFFYSYKEEFDLADTECRRGILERMYSNENANGKWIGFNCFFFLNHDQKFFHLSESWSVWLSGWGVWA